MTLEFSPFAQQDMRDIAAYLRHNFPDKGLTTRHKIVETCKMLHKTPLAGRISNEQNTREFVLPQLPYRIIYQVLSERMIVLRVYHTSRRHLG